MSHLHWHRGVDRNLNGIIRQVEKEAAQPEKLIAILMAYFANKKYDDALQLLENNKTNFMENQSFHLWEFWMAQLLVKKGRSKEALRLVSTSSDQRNKREIKILALRSDGERSGNWTPFLEYLENIFDSTKEISYLLECCRVKAQNKEWDYISDRSELLIKIGGTVEALRLSVYSKFMTGKTADCLELIDTHRNYFPKNQISLEFHQLKSECQRRMGLISQALRDAENIVTKDPSIKNLEYLLNLQFEKGDLKGFTISARRLLNIKVVDSALFLRVSRILVLEDPNLSKQFWLKAFYKGIEDSNITEAIDLGFKLGLDSEMQPLINKMHIMAEKGAINVKMVALKDLINYHKERVEDIRRVRAQYEKGFIPVHLIAHRNRIALSMIYHALASENYKENKPFRQHPIFIRHGGRALNIDLIIPQIGQTLCMDCTAFLIAEHIQILDNIERSYKPILISRHLISSFLYQRDLLIATQPQRIEAYKEILDLNEKRRFKVIELFQSAFKGKDHNERSSYPNGHGLLGEILNEEGYIIDFKPIDNDIKQQYYSDYIEEYGDRIINFRTLIEALKSGGVLSNGAYKKALNNLGSEGQKSLDEITPKINSRIFLPPTVPHFLATCGLLDTICRNFTVYLDQTELKDAKYEMSIHHLRKDVSEWLQKLVDRISTKIDEGVYKIIPENSSPEYKKSVSQFKDNPDMISFLDIMSHQFKEGDVIWADDRFLNSYERKDITPVIGISEILLSLYSLDELSKEECYDRLIKLRSGNFRYIPIISDELVYHLNQAQVQNDRLVETSELCQLRRYISACQLDNDCLQFPPLSPNHPNPHGEIAYYIKTSRAISEAIIGIWKQDMADEVKIAQSNWIIENLHTGTFGVCHLIKSLEVQNNDHYYLALDIVDLLVSGINFVGMSLQKNKSKKSILSKYFDWLYNYILKNRFKADPQILGIVVDLLKKNLLDLLNREEETEEHEKATIILINDLYFEMPEIIKNEISLDDTFMEQIRIKTGEMIAVGDWKFYASDFWLAASKSLDEKNYLIEGFEPKNIFKMISNIEYDLNKITLTITNKETKEERVLSDPVFNLLLGQIDKREAVLYQNRNWFDCDNNKLNNCIETIVSIVDPYERIKQTESWREKSASIYYKKFTDKIKNESAFNLNDLMPPSIEGLLNHLRINKDNFNDSDFATILNESSSTLLNEEGLKSALERLNCLPIKLPKILIDSALELSSNQLSNLMDELRKEWKSTISKINLIYLALKLSHKNESFFRIAKETAEFLLNDKNEKEVFRLFIAILNRIKGELISSPQNKTFRSSLLLALSWAHSNRLVNIILSLGAPAKELADKILYAERTIDVEVFYRDSLIWYDVSHPRNVEFNSLILRGLSVILSDFDENYIKRLNLYDLASSVAYMEVDGQKFPNPTLVRNLLNASNFMNSYLGIDGKELKCILGENAPTQDLSFNSLQELTQIKLDELGKNPNRPENWPLICAIIWGFPLDESFQDKLSKIIKRLNFAELHNKSSESAEMALLMISQQIPYIKSASLKETMGEKLIHFAAKLNEKPYPNSKNQINKKQPFLNIELMILESVLSTSIVLGDAKESSKNFAHLMKKIIFAWPKIAEFCRPVISSLMSELSVSVLRDLWELELTIRTEA